MNKIFTHRPIREGYYLFKGTYQLSHTNMRITTDRFFLVQVRHLISMDANLNTDFFYIRISPEWICKDKIFQTMGEMMSYMKGEWIELDDVNEEVFNKEENRTVRFV